MDLFSNQPPPDAKLRDSVIRLFESGQKKSQVLALSQCKLVGMLKSELIWGYVKKNWDKKKIISDWGKAAAGGYAVDIVIFKLDFLGGDLKVLDDSDMVYLSIPGNDNILLSEWLDSDVDATYKRAYKRFKHTMLNLPQIIKF